VKAVEAVIALPIGPEIVCVAGEIVRTPMSKTTDVVATPDVAPVAVMVTVSEATLVGVPEIAPFVGLNVKPAGSVPLVTA